MDVVVFFFMENLSLRPRSHDSGKSPGWNDRDQGEQGHALFTAHKTTFPAAFGDAEDYGTCSVNLVISVLLISPPLLSKHCHSLSFRTAANSRSAGPKYFDDKVFDAARDLTG
jgi:hypothetical protein